MKRPPTGAASRRDQCGSISAIWLTDAILYRVVARASVPSPIARSVGIGATVIPVMAVSVLITPIWVANTHIYAGARQVNSLSLGRPRRTNSHRADKAKRERGFDDRSHVAVLSVAPSGKRSLEQRAHRSLGFKTGQHLDFGAGMNRSSKFQNGALSAA